MEGSAGGSLLSVACEGMEGVDGGLGSRVAGVNGWGWSIFRLRRSMSGCGLDGENVVFRLRDATSGCRCHFFLGAFGAVWMDEDGGFSKMFGC